jgi:hypothetical protein
MPNKPQKREPLQKHDIFSFMSHGITKAWARAKNVYGVAVLIGGAWFTLAAAVNQKARESADVSFWFTYGAPAGCLLIAFLIHLCWLAPYESYTELWDAKEEMETDLQKQVSELKTEIGILDGRVAAISAPRFRIQCGEKTTKRDGIFNQPVMTSSGAPYNFQRSIALFGFRLWNLGAKTAKKCRVRIVRIEKDSLPICSDIAGLGFEADNPGDDLEEVDIANNVPARLTVFSIFHEDGQICAGSADLRWRHASIHPLFKQSGEYDFVISISSDGDGSDPTLTQDERFTFHWRGDYKQSKIQYRGPNVYVHPGTQMAIV